MREFLLLFVGIISLFAIGIFTIVHTTAATFNSENISNFANTTVSEMKKDASNELGIANKVENETLRNATMDELQIQESVQNDSDVIESANIDRANIFNDVTGNFSANLIQPTPK